MGGKIMKCIGNYKDWLDDSWISEILKSDGQKSPKDLLKNNSMHSEDIRVEKAGYDLNAFYYSLFEKRDVSFKLTIPGLPSGEIRWWIVKMMPGQFMPVHIDPKIGIIDNIERFWMPWTDWDNGHIFSYKDSIICNYKAGDLYTFDDPEALHGAANIGLVPRITLNIGVIRNNI